MNLNDISTQLLYVTLPISVIKNNGNNEFGTGFFVSYQAGEDINSTIPLLITNWHVVKDAEKIILRMSSANDAGLPVSTDPINLELNAKDWVKYYDETLDLAVMLMGPVFNNLSNLGKKFFYRTISFNLFPDEKVMGDLAALEEVVFIGYPSGIFDAYNLSPLIRRGITSTPVWRNYEGKPRFVIDAGVFPGSSGSPVFILNQGSYATKEGINLGNRLYFLGVIATSFIRQEVKQQNTYLGLGEVIKSNKIKEFIDQTLNKLNIC